MTYGGLLKNALGSSILNEKEIPVLYRGKLSVTLPAYVAGSAAHVINLYNIPSSVPVVVFTRAKAISSDSRCYTNVPNWIDKSGAISKLIAINESDINDGNNTTWAAALLEIYVFIPAKYIPLPVFGLMVKNNANEVAFHTGRPPLSVVNLVSVTGADISFMAGKPAASSQVLYVNYLGNTDFSGFLAWEGGVYYTGAMQNPTETLTGIGVHSRTITQQGVSHIQSSIYSDDPATTYTVAVIDGAYYDQFSSLSNYA